jgi:N4-gp56 family major capsid protein
MAVTIRETGWGGASGNTSQLLTSFIREEIKVLEPQLQYARLGVRRDSPKGFDRIVFPQTNQLPVKINTSMVTVGGPGAMAGGGSVFGAGASIQGGAAADARGYPVSSTEGVAAITEGTNPTAIKWGATSYSTGPAQYGILVEVSDLLVHNSAIEVVESASMQVRNALARLVDTAIQTVVNSGTNGVIYAGGKTARTGLAAGDLLTQSEMTKAYRNLAASNAGGLKPYEGKYYVGVIHPFVEADLMSNTSTGAFQDVGRYTSVDDLRAGALGDFRGIRYLRSAYQNYFNSTVNVFPTTVLGDQSFGWGFFQEPTPILVTTPDSNDPLNLFTSIGGKVTLGATRFEDAPGTHRIARVESATSS